MDLGCYLNETLKRFSLDVELTGSVGGSSLPAVAPQISLLPDSFPSLDLVIPTVDFSYKLICQVNINLAKKKFTLGETKIDFSVDFLATASQHLPILPSTDVLFNGTLGLEASFTYSSFAQGWTYAGGYVGTLEATANAAPGVANLGLRAYDDDMFDDKPRESMSACTILLSTHLFTIFTLCLSSPTMFSICPIQL